MCAHCERRRPRLTIEWHPGICEWQCSNFTDCDAAIARNETRAHARLIQDTDKDFWKRWRNKPGQKLDMTKLEDRQQSSFWRDIFQQKQHEARKAA
jgi:hypothetical protein